MDTMDQSDRDEMAEVWRALVDEVFEWTETAPFTREVVDLAGYKAFRAKCPQTAKAFYADSRSLLEYVGNQ